MSAQNTTGQTLDLAEDGTAVPLPSGQTLRDFTAEDDSTAFSVPATGTYFISYRVDVTEPLRMTSEVLRNGEALPGSAFSPATATNSYGATLVADLNEGDTLSLQLSGLSGTATLQGGAGAGLTVIRLA